MLVSSIDSQCVWKESLSTAFASALRIAYSLKARVTKKEALDFEVER